MELLMGRTGAGEAIGNEQQWEAAATLGWRNKGRKGYLVEAGNTVGLSG